MLPKLRTDKQVIDELDAGGCHINQDELSILVSMAGAWIDTGCSISNVEEKVKFINYDKLTKWLENPVIYDTGIY